MKPPHLLSSRSTLARVFVSASLGFVVCFQCADGTSALAKENKEKADEEVDFLGLAARLIADNKVDRAAQMLLQFDKAAEGADLAKYHTLQGLVHLKQGSARDAIVSFESAIKAGQADPAIHLYLAQAHFSLKDYKKTISHLKSAGPAAKESPAAFGILAQSHFELKEYEPAFKALDGGRAAFPQDRSLLRTKIFYLVELGLYQEVTALSENYLKAKDIDESEYIALSEALRRGRQTARAQSILGQARLRFPESTQVAVQLAHTYVDEQKPLSAAMLFEDAARFDPKYSLEAAELYKQAGRTELALALNSRITDQKEKLKQRLSLMLEGQRFEIVLGMLPALSRVGLMADDNVRYATAFAAYKLGEFEQAETLLRPIKDPELFRASTGLRKAMSSCRESGWECF